MERVLATVREYRAIIDEQGAERRSRCSPAPCATPPTARASSRACAPRATGSTRASSSGDEEARLTFRGATSERAAGDATPTLVIDVGGGSTELVVGSGDEVSFHVSTQAGVVRHTERHLATDPPTPRRAARARRGRPRDLRGSGSNRGPPTARRGIAVAGTATSLGAIDLDLEHYDARHASTATWCPLAACRRILERLAALPEARAPHGRAGCTPIAPPRSSPAWSWSSRRWSPSASMPSRSPTMTSCAAPPWKWCISAPPERRAGPAGMSRIGAREPAIRAGERRSPDRAGDGRGRVNRHHHFCWPDWTYV